jgi:hypothetical protein
MVRQIKARKRVLCIAAALVCICAAIPAVALASGGSDQWCDGCYLGAGYSVYDNNYYAGINTTTSYDYYADGFGSCTGVYQTSDDEWVGAECHGPVSTGANTVVCADNTGCLSSPTAGHAIMENYENGGAWYFTGTVDWSY